MTQLVFDPRHCPLCGQPNACAMATPNTGAAAPGPCWCTRVHFSADLLKQVPEAARNKACICEACVVASDQPSQYQNQGQNQGAGA